MTTSTNSDEAPAAGSALIAAASAPLTLTLYSSSFCAACSRTRQVLEEAERLLAGRVLLREVNVADDPVEAERVAITVTPTTVLTDPVGGERGRAAGVPSTPQVLALLARHLERL